MAGGRHRGLRLAAGGLRDRPPASRKQLACIRRLASEIPGLDAGRLDVLARRLCGKTVAELRNGE